MKHIIFLFCFFCPIAIFANGSVDSIKMAQKEFNSIYAEITDINNRISCYDDWLDEEAGIELLKTKLDRAGDRWNLYRDEAEVWDVYEKCYKDLHVLGKKGEEYKKKGKLRQISNSMDQYGVRMDSLLEIGQGYESQKKGDSVKLVKDESGKMWAEVQSMKACSSEDFESNDVLKVKYECLRQKYDEIAKLSEKTSPKIDDILLKVAIGLAALAIIAGMIGSFVRGRKLRKGTDDTPTFDL